MITNVKHLLLLLVVLTTLAATLAYAKDLYGSTVSIEPPTMIGQTPTSMNLSADDLDRDITIDPNSELNETQSVSTVGATDIDINAIPPVGVTVVITNESVTVTEDLVTLQK